MNVIEKLIINGKTYTIRDPRLEDGVIQQLMERLEVLENKMEQVG